LDSFGIAEKIMGECNPMIEVSFWNPDSKGGIQRNSRVVNGMPGLSRFSEAVLHQGRMEKFFLDAIKASYPEAKSAPRETDLGDRGSNAEEGVTSTRIRVERAVVPTELHVDESVAGDEDAYPVTVKLRHLSEEEAAPKQVLSNMRDGIFRSNLADDDLDDVLERTEPRRGNDETVLCKYLIGCDGAHSWTRKSLGKEFEMIGETTDFIW
jgi:phenol 2-monooxygenase (NADPH)